MPKDKPNKLAPTPVNQLPENLYDPSELYQFLSSNQSLPAWIPQRPFGDAYGHFYPVTNIMIADKPTDERQRASVAHEMTHSAQALMARAAEYLRDRQYKKEKLTPVEEQFIENYRKTFGDVPGPLGLDWFSLKPKIAREQLERQTNALFSSMKPDGDDKYYNYRTQPKEAQAFGIGSSSARLRYPDAPPHANSSLATTFSILMENYGRLPESTRKTVSEMYAEQTAKTRPSGLQDMPERKFTPPIYNYPDPFVR